VLGVLSLCFNLFFSYLSAVRAERFGRSNADEDLIKCLVMTIEKRVSVILENFFD